MNNFFCSLYLLRPWSSLQSLYVSHVCLSSSCRAKNGIAMRKSVSSNQWSMARFIDQFGRFASHIWFSWAHHHHLHQQPPPHQLSLPNRRLQLIWITFFQSSNFGFYPTLLIKHISGTWLSFTIYLHPIHFLLPSILKFSWVFPPMSTTIVHKELVNYSSSVRVSIQDAWKFTQIHSEERLSY